MQKRLAIALVLVAVLGAAIWFSLIEQVDQVDQPSTPPPPSAGPAPLAGTPRARPLLRADSAGSGLAEEEALAPRPRVDSAALDASSPDSGDEQAQVEARKAMEAFLERNAAAAAKSIDRYCAETRKARALEGPKSPPRTNDAAIFLGVRVDWENGRVGMMHLPASITQRMVNPPRNWRNFTPADYAGLGFGWLRELLVFDHWSLTGDGPMKDIDSASNVEAPLPNYIELQNWMKLRLIKGKNEGDLAQASLEVRHLADLCASSGTLIGEMNRSGMYAIERSFWESVGLAPPVPLPSAEEAQTLRQTLMAGPYFLFPGVSREVKEKALNCTPNRCAVLTEAIGATASMRLVLPGTADLDWLLGQRPCDPGQAARLSRGRSFPLTTLAEGHAGELPLARWMNLVTDGGL